MLHRAWRWLTEDLDSANAEDALAVIAEALTPAERTAALWVRVCFTALEATMFLGAFALMPGVAGGLMRWLDIGAALALGISGPPLLWFLLRKPRALLKSALLARLTRRATARTARQANPVLDAPSASGAPVAVSADADARTSTASTRSG